MGKLQDGDDGLPVEEVGYWAREKHEYLCRYVDISRAARRKYIGQAGATYIDLFCGPGRSVVRETGQFIDGGVVAAWNKSVEGGVPFSCMYVADLDSTRRSAAVSRLRMLGAPVVEINGDAVTAAQTIAQQVNPYGLHFAFIDPFDLEALDFRIIQSLARLKRIDMLVHVSQMDLQRNAVSYATAERSPFDLFAPGWREKVNIACNQQDIRRQVFEYWRDLVANNEVWPSAEMRLITGSKNQPLYWLLLAAKHDLAHKFWKTACNKEGQGELF